MNRLLWGLVGLLVLAGPGWGQQESPPGRTDRAGAMANLLKGLATWDGAGFMDAATKTSGRYSTYKLALAMIAARALNCRLTIQGPILARLGRQQVPNGGLLHEYDRAGKPVGQTDTRTAALVLLALQGW